jgi:hypothetical protein
LKVDNEFVGRCPSKIAAQLENSLVPLVHLQHTELAMIEKWPFGTVGFGSDDGRQLWNREFRAQL